MRLRRTITWRTRVDATAECRKAHPHAFCGKNVELAKIPDAQRYGLALGSSWCKLHGEEFCNLILSGATTRSDIPLVERQKRDALKQGLTMQSAFAERRAERETRYAELYKMREGARR